jgi:hypothetical protein
MRSLIGRWLKELKDDATALRRVIGESRNMIEPIGWITKAVEARAKAAAPFEQTDDHGWRNRLTSFHANGAWPEKWGGKFPGDHPGHPAALLAEFGFGSGATATAAMGA